LLLLCLQHECNSARLKKAKKNQRLKESDNPSTPLHNVAELEAPILHCDLLKKTANSSYTAAAKKHKLQPVTEHEMVKLSPARRRIIDWNLKTREPEDSDSNEYTTDDEHQALTDSEGLEDMFAARAVRGKFANHLSQCCCFIFEEDWFFFPLYAYSFSFVFCVAKFLLLSFLF
jgi:hypothetical protein